jgi:hypothetical protein
VYIYLYKRAKVCKDYGSYLTACASMGADEHMNERENVPLTSD